MNMHQLSNNKNWIDTQSFLVESKLLVATAESATTGMLSERITSLSGSSAYFVGGLLAYHNKIKISYLGVDESLLSSKGAVSPEVAKKMAEGACKFFSVDIGISITGTAGPTGGTAKKPIGTAYVGLSFKGNSWAYHVLPQKTKLSRHENKEYFTLMALKHLSSLCSNIKKGRAV